MATVAQLNRRQGFVAQWLIAQWRDGLGLAVSLFLVLRLAFSLFGLLAASLMPVYAPCTAAAPATTLYSEGFPLGVLGVWQRADGCMYEMIAALGYQPEHPHQFAFFPLYPLLLRLASSLLAGSYTLGGMLISGLAYIAAITGLYRLASRDFDSQIARRAVLYLSIFPSAFFLFAGFTEALFLAFSVWTLHTARHRLWLWAGLLGFLAALTRTQGLLLALPLAWELWRSWREGGHRLWRPLAVLLGPLCGFLLYNGYTLNAAGINVLQAQRLWGMESAPPWTVLADSWRFIVNQGNPVEAVNLLLMVTCTTLTIIGLGRVPFSYTLIAAPQLLLLLTRETYDSPLMSVSRLLIVVFPTFIVLAVLGRRPWLHRTWLTVSLLLLTALFIVFIGGPFVA
jgi:hypothetical protein